MEVFISWSGERSRRAAEALRGWLPKVINALRPWLSAADVDKGSRWSGAVASRLSDCRFGIICLTPANLHSDWILFEAGALSKTLSNTYVCPLLFDLQPADVKGPLAQFQATRAAKNDIEQLLRTINTALGNGQSLTDAHLSEAFEVWWPKLEEQIRELPSDEEQNSPTRPEREILEEILALVRAQARSGSVSLSGADLARRTSKAVPLPDESEGADYPKLRALSDIGKISLSDLAAKSVQTSESGDTEPEEA